MKLIKHTTHIDFNVMIDNGSLQPGDGELVFSDEEVHVLPPETTMVDILVLAGISRSKTQARKNAIIRRYEGAEQVEEEEDGELVMHSIETKVAAKDEEIRPGFSEYTIGKLRHWVTIWNPKD